MMLRLLLNILFVVIVARLVLALAQRARRYLGRLAQGSGKERRTGESGFDKLSPYDIQEADFEDLEEGRR
jgi:hypothetical protein